jgi:hypothetical protein
MPSKRSKLARFAAAVFLTAAAFLTMAAPVYGQPMGSNGTPPPATPRGCHGFHTVLHKQLTGDPAQGPAIVAQTRTPQGRGGLLQEFLATVCGRCSQAK